MPQLKRVSRTPFPMKEAEVSLAALLHWVQNKLASGRKHTFPAFSPDAPLCWQGAGKPVAFPPAELAMGFLSGQPGSLWSLHVACLPRHAAQVPVITEGCLGLRSLHHSQSPSSPPSIPVTAAFGQCRVTTAHQWDPLASGWRRMGQEGRREAGRSGRCSRKL